MKKIAQLGSEYPRQYWLLFWGVLISTIGSAMIWPFLMIYVSEKLDKPLSTIAFLLTINSLAGLVSSAIAGPLTDRIGRKWVMAVSLLLHALSFIFLGMADTVFSFVLLMLLAGFVGPIYRVGADAMVADLIEPQKRSDAYAKMRISNNVGVALGPSIGGFIAVASYNTTFLIAAIGLAIYGLLVVFFARETIPTEEETGENQNKPLSGYGQVFKDRHFIFLSLALTIAAICVSLVFVLLSVYSKENFGIPENQFGFIMAANAVMVILFQVRVTKIASKRSPYRMMTLGAFLYALGVGSVAFGRSFPAFLISMIILTCGELILVPTATTVVANISPADMRGRYMSVYNLAWGLAYGIGPVIGSLLNDNIAPSAIWYGGFVIGLISTVMFFMMALKKPAND